MNLLEWSHQFFVQLSNFVPITLGGLDVILYLISYLGKLLTSLGVLYLVLIQLDCTLCISSIVPHYLQKHLSIIILNIFIQHQGKITRLILHLHLTLTRVFIIYLLSALVVHGLIKWLFRIILFDLKILFDIKRNIDKFLYFQLNWIFVQV